MATPSLTSPRLRRKIKARLVVGIALISLASALPPLQAQPADNILRIGLVEDLSGATKEGGSRVRALFENYAQTTNARGGIDVGKRSYKIQVIVYDAGGSPMKAHESMRRATESDKVVVAVCPYITCMHVAEETKTPLILTESSRNLSKEQPTTFLVRAPTPDNFADSLIIKTLDEALKQASEPTSARVAEALRSLKIEGALGEVRFDKSGNNVGLVAFPFRPDGAGCTNSCAKDCPSNCGKNKCSKSDGNECCSICGRPQPN